MPTSVLAGEKVIGPIVETKAFEQLGIFVLDGSPSMQQEGETGQAKHLEVDQAMRGVTSRLKVSRIKQNINLAAMSYSDDVQTDRLVPTPVTAIDETGNFDPLHPNGSGTAIGDALAAAFDKAKQFLAQTSRVPRSVVIVLMTDGQNNMGRDPIKVADEIKASGLRISICAAGYGKSGDIDEMTLKKLVSDASGYSRVYDAEQLRKFFERSVSSVVV
jgi:hypothetical protein